MRELTPEQKKLLKDWFNNNYDGGCKFNLADKIEFDLYEKIESLHPTEIHYQNVNRYLEKLVEQKN